MRSTFLIESSAKYEIVGEVVVEDGHEELELETRNTRGFTPMKGSHVGKCNKWSTLPALLQSITYDSISLP